jgi:hypothetical protein
MGTDGDRSRLQGPVGLVEIMGARTEVGLLGHTGTAVEFHWAEAVGMASVAQAGPMVKREVPGVLDASPLMHEGLTMNGGAKQTKHEQAPRVARLGSPAAEKRPGIVPEHQAQSVAAAPGAGEAAGLAVGLQVGHCSGVGLRKRHQCFGTRKARLRTHVDWRGATHGPDLMNREPSQENPTKTASFRQAIDSLWNNQYLGRSALLKGQCHLEGDH